MTIPICQDCGEELVDYLDVEEGRCLDCQMDPDNDSDESSEE